MAVTLRRGRLDEVEWVLSELKKFDEFVDGPYPLVEDEDHVRGILREMIQNHYFMVAEIECDITGAAVPVAFLGALSLPRHPFNPKRHYLAEQCWWKAGDSFSASKGAALIAKHYTEEARKVYDGGGIATIALEKHSPVNQRTLERMGWRLSELSFVFHPTGAA